MGRFITSLFKKRKLEKRGFVKTYSRRKYTGGEKVPKKSDVLFVFFCMVIIWGAFSYSFFSSSSISSSIFVEGQKSSGNFYAAVDFDYEDSAQTELLRKQAEAQVPPLFSIEHHKVKSSLSSFDQLVKAVRNDEVPTDKTVEKIIGALGDRDKQNLKELFATSIITDFIRGHMVHEISEGVGDNRESAQRLSTNRYGVIGTAERKSYYSIDEFQTPESISSFITAQVASRFMQSLPVQSVLKQVLKLIIMPNLQFDVQETENAKKLKRDLVKPVMIHVSASEIVIPKGKVLASNDVEKWRYYVKARDAVNLGLSINEYAQYAIISFLIISLFFVLIKFAFLRLANQPKLLLLFSTVIGLNLLLNLFIHRLFIMLIERFSVNWDYISLVNVLLPVALGTILLTLLIDYKTGLLCCLMTAVLSGLMRYFDYLTVLNIVFVGTIACMFVNNARNRAAITRTCVVAALANAFIQFPYLMDEMLPNEFYFHLAWLTVGGFTILYFTVSFLLPTFEFLFGRTTNLSLLELCDLNHPLLQRLQMEAPGSYHHSLLVATVADHAAKAIGANPLLARVCAYFHDIGKIANSEYFTENNFENISKHTELKPKMSSLVILNHVKEGVNLALRFKLKKPIIEAIEQHHGKSLVSYFYHLAKGEADEKYSVEDSDFRYPGPLPRRKEIVILSIADPCEAASRSLDKPTLNNIESLVNSIVRQRFEDGHFAEADITLKELEIVKKSIAKTLSNMLHTRVAYPKDEKEETDETDVQQSGAVAESDESGQDDENSAKGR